MLRTPLMESRYKGIEYEWFSFIGCSTVNHNGVWLLLCCSRLEIYIVYLIAYFFVNFSRNTAAELKVTNVK